MKSKADVNGVAEAIAYASSHGIIVGNSTTSTPGTDLKHAPMTYTPSPLDAACYVESKRITPSLNTMVARIAADHHYLRQTLEETAAADADFTGRLLALLGTAPRPGVELGIYRYDYFVHADAQTRALRMVEMNLIAASFACLGTRTADMHRYLASSPVCDVAFDAASLPPNDAMGGLARGIAAAHAAYVDMYGTGADAARCAALMVVQPGERNAYDQHLLRMAAWETHGVEMIRLSLAEIGEFCNVDENRRLYLLHPEHSGKRIDISVVYFRAGYSPDDYPSEKEWSARALMERSVAAKCPSVAVQLVGTKKIQQVLDIPGEVERFVDTKEEADAIRATFARQYSLSAADDGDKVAQMGIENPEDFVLKPQREGGGNNLYSEDLKQALQTMSASERSAYVLMERIRPLVVKNIVIRDGDYSETDIVSEFGVYGVHVMRDGVDSENYTAGTLLRSKAASQNDGGVAAGVAVLDSPQLIK